MKWPFSKRISYSDTPLFNRFYLHATHADNLDHAILWGTEIDADGLKAFLADKNRRSQRVITTSHVLIRAMGLALAQFPDANVRVVSRKLYRLRGCNVRMAFLHKKNNEIDLMMIPDANTKSLEMISLEVWHRLLEASRGDGGRDRDLRRLRRLPGFGFRQVVRLYNFLDRHFRLPTVGRLDAIRSGCAMVNDLTFAGAPPMRNFKPTRFPDNSDLLNLSLGPPETKVVLRDGAPVNTTIMPLFLRADHRVLDVYKVGLLLGFIRDLLNNPQRLDGPDAGLAQPS